MVHTSPAVEWGSVADWVQAVGTIFAVCGAFAIAFWEGARTHRRAAAERREVWQAVIDLATLLADQAEKEAEAIAEEGDVYDVFGGDMSTFERLQSAMDWLDLAKLGSPQGILLVMDFHRLAKLGAEVVTGAAKESETNHEIEPLRVTATQAWANLCRDLERKLRDLRSSATGQSPQRPRVLAEGWHGRR